jgi:hypothetical protein
LVVAERLFEQLVWIDDASPRVSGSSDLGMNVFEFDHAF